MKTVDVKIVITADMDGYLYLESGKNEWTSLFEHSKELDKPQHMGASYAYLDNPLTRFIITATIPIPEPQEVKGEVGSYDPGTHEAVLKTTIENALELLKEERAACNDGSEYQQEFSKCIKDLTQEEL